MKKKIYLITGCAGFIGSNLVKKIYKNCELILVDDLSGSSIKNLPKVIRKKLIRKKIQNIKNLKVKKIDGIFHLAAQSSVPLSLINFYKSSKNNLESTLKVFDLSKKYSAPIIFASSAAVYGNLSLGSDIKNKFSITSPYAQDKLTTEDYAKMSFEVYKIPSVCLRLFNVYGPGQAPSNPYSSVIPKFIQGILKKTSITINGGFQTRDFIYIQDVINIMLKSMTKLQKERSFKIFNVCTGRSVKIDFLFNLIQKNIGNKPKLIRRKLDKFDPKKSSGTFKKLHNFLKLKKSNFIRLEDGLRMTIDHIKNFEY